MRGDEERGRKGACQCGRLEPSRQTPAHDARDGQHHNNVQALQDGGRAALVAGKGVLGLVVEIDLVRGLERDGKVIHHGGDGDVIHPGGRFLHLGGPERVEEAAAAGAEREGRQD